MMKKMEPNLDSDLESSLDSDANPDNGITDFRHVQNLRENRAQYCGTTRHHMQPQQVTVEPVRQGLAYIKQALLQLGYQGDLPYCQKIPGISYSQRADLFSAQQMTLLFSHADHPLFEVTVPQGGFNPYTGPIAGKFVELILHSDIVVENKNVIDLGCGSGNIGIAAILMGAARVLFSDVMPNYLDLIRTNSVVAGRNGAKNHGFVCQDILRQTLADPKNVGAFDLITISTPTFIDGPDDEAAQYPGLFQPSRFLDELIAQASMALNAANGQLVVWLMLNDFSGENFIRFLHRFKGYFDIAELKCLAIEPQSNITVFDESDIGAGNFYFLFSITKRAHPLQSDDFEGKMAQHLLTLSCIFQEKGLLGWAEQCHSAYLTHISHAGPGGMWVDT
jgi:SAM-dependent methyltransferase